MSIPKLYTVLPTKDGSPDIETLTSHSSQLVAGNDGETFVVLSYFPSVQKYSDLNNIVLNKYVLFVLEEQVSKTYSVEWHYDVLDSNQDSVLDRFVRDEIDSPSPFEYSLGLRDVGLPLGDNWEFTLKIECHIYKNGAFEEAIELRQLLLPIEPDLLSENLPDDGANSAVALGNEATTHFVRGHLSEYLIDKETELNPTGDDSPENASVFVKQTAAIVYSKVLSVIDSIGPEGVVTVEEPRFNSPFDLIFDNQEIERSIINETPFEEDAYFRIGICDLNLHHVLPILLNEPASRARLPENVVSEVRSAFDLHYEKYIEAYHRCAFPKSAIGLSVDIFDLLFKAFQSDANDLFHIYQTTESSAAEKNAKIAEWKGLRYSELAESSNDQFMKNLIAEHFIGFYEEVTTYALEASSPQVILRMDGSQFIQKILSPIASVFSLDDFLSSNELLNQKVEQVVRGLSAHKRVAQMLMPAAEMAWKRDVDDEDGDGKTNDWVRDFTRDGRSITEIPRLIADHKIGGVLLLNGTKEQVARWSQDFIAANKTAKGIPLFLSADAEPSLINDKIRGLPEIKKAVNLRSLAEVEDTTVQICDIIQEYGVNYNFAPVTDVAKNLLEERGFSTDHDAVVDYSKKFIEVVQSRNIIATAKHFPGHGEVIGDTHKPVSGGKDEKLVVIDGAFKELDIYPPLIADGVISIMIAHIVVRNNDYHTDTLPASLSKRIVTDLLRDALGFKGLIVTDGMNMGAVTYVEDECIKAVEAGVDIIEIPLDPEQTHADILAKYNAEADFAEKVDTACRRIIRAKICLGLI